MPLPLTRRHLAARATAACALAIGGSLLAAGGARADSEASIYAANPALAAIARRDPAKARKLLDEIDADLKRPSARGFSPLDAEDRTTLEGNPLLGKLYIHDASAALLLLKRVKEAAAGGKQ